MVNEVVILLTPVEDYSNHRLSKYVGPYLVRTTSFDLYFCEPLRRIFSKVIVYDYIKRTTEIGVNGINEEIIDLARREHPKYLLWLPAYYEFRESTFENIRKEGTIVLAWFGDDEYRFDEYSKWWIPYLDYCVTNTIEKVPKYRELGAQVVQAIPCSGISIERDWSRIEEKYDVSFVGSRNPYREQLIDELKSRNIPIRVFGRGWERVPFEEMIDIFKTSKINLNFSRISQDKLQIKGRIFEVCLAGGFLLTEYIPGIDNYFDIDKEIVCFENAEEMVNKVTYYLNHETERRAIAEAGWRRAIGEYTSFHMVSKVFRYIEEDLAAKDKEDNLHEDNLHPQELRMPMRIRKKFSDYYADWGEAYLSLENYEGLWKAALALSISYNPFNLRTWLYYITGFSPSFIRPILVRPYRAIGKLCRALRSRLSSIPYLRKMKQRFTNKLFRT